jgi:teichuronic acid biosynthesis glycosyltransferase TuaC
MVTSEWPSAGEPYRVPFLVQQVRHLRALSLTVDVFAFKGQKNPANYLKAWLRLRQQHHLANYDIIHAHFGQSGLLALPVKRPLVVTFHGTDLQGDVAHDGGYSRKGRLLPWLSYRVARKASAVILVAAHLKRFIPPAVSATVIPCGVDLELFHPAPREQARRRLGLPLDKKLVLFAANPQRPVKRYNLAQAAVHALADSKVELVTTGAVAHTDMPIYMNACDALLLTSRHEGSPTVVKEALACNLPVVSVSVGDVAERLAGVAGCLVCNHDSPNAIAVALKEVLRNGRSSNGRAAIATLDERLMARQILSVYRRLLPGSFTNNPLYELEDESSDPACAGKITS